MHTLKLGGLALLAIAIAIAQSAVAASAGTPDAGDVRVVVRYADLDLATPVGAHILRARVDRAAMLVMSDIDQRDLGRMAQLRKARAAALAAANAIIAAHADANYAAANPVPTRLDF